MEMIAIVAAVGQVVGTIMQSNAQRDQADAIHAQGEQQVKYAEYRAKQAEMLAGQKRAAAQRTMAAEDRRMNIALSRAQALAAASGAGAADPTVVNIMAGITGEGTFNKQTGLWEGESAAVGLENQARASRYEGQAAFWKAQGDAKSMDRAADATLLSGFSKAAGMPGSTSLMDKFSSGPMPFDGYYPTIADAVWS